MAELNPISVLEDFGTATVTMLFFHINTGVFCDEWIRVHDYLQVRASIIICGIAAQVFDSFFC